MTKVYHQVLPKCYPQTISCNLLKFSNAPQLKRALKIFLHSWRTQWITRRPVTLWPWHDCKHALLIYRYIYIYMNQIHSQVLEYKWQCLSDIYVWLNFNLKFSQAITWKKNVPGGQIGVGWGVGWCIGPDMIEKKLYWYIDICD